MIAGGLAAGIAAFVLAFTTLPAEDAAGYTELWLLPGDGAAGIEVGVASQEQEPVDYQLRIRLGDRPQPMLRSFTLAPAESRVFRPVAAARESGPPVPVTVTLFRDDRPDDVYRRVTGFSKPGAE